jgi:hypothetical protein
MTIIDMTEIIINIFGMVGIVNGLTRFDPYIDFIHYSLNKIFGCKISKVRDFLLKLLTCGDCLTFWTILIIFQNPLWAGIGYIVSNWVSKKIDNLWIG